MLNIKKLILILVLGNIQLTFGMLTSLRITKKPLQLSRSIVKKSRSNIKYTDGDLIKNQSWHDYFAQSTKSENEKNIKTISYVGGDHIQTGPFGFVNKGSYSSINFGLSSLVTAPFKAVWRVCSWYKNRNNSNPVNDGHQDIVGGNKIEQKIFNKNINTFSGLGNDKVGGTLELTFMYDNNDSINVVINNKTGDKSYDVIKGNNRFKGNFSGNQKDLELFIKNLVTK